MFKKKIKVNFQNYLLWLFVLGFLCAFFSVATAFDRSNDLFAKAISFIAGWWIFIVAYYVPACYQKMNKKIKNNHKKF